MHSNSKRKRKEQRKKYDKKLYTLQHQLLRNRKEKNNGKHTDIIQKHGAVI